jgi:hypothetical protein
MLVSSPSLTAAPPIALFFKIRQFGAALTRQQADGAGKA